MRRQEQDKGFIKLDEMRSSFSRYWYVQLAGSNRPIGKGNDNIDQRPDCVHRKGV